MHYVNAPEMFELLFLGLLAGFEIAVHYGIAASPKNIGQPAQIRIRQAMIRRLRVLAPGLFIPAFLLTLLVMVRDSHMAGSLLRSVSVAALVIWIIIRIVRTVPVNRAMLEWNPEAPPENWRRLVETTERFHVVAAWAAVIAFGCSIMSVFHAYC